HLAQTQAPRRHAAARFRLGAPGYTSNARTVPVARLRNHRTWRRRHSVAFRIIGSRAASSTGEVIHRDDRRSLSTKPRSTAPQETRPPGPRQALPASAVQGLLSLKTRREGSPSPRRQRREQIVKWVTWENIGVDRIACAWLIRRFIDPKAKFVFISRDDE